MERLLPQFVVPEKLIHPVNANWMIYTFTMCLDSFIHEYRNQKYLDPRIMKKVMTKIHGQENAGREDDNFFTGVEDTVKLTIDKQHSLIIKDQDDRRMTDRLKKQTTMAMPTPFGKNDKNHPGESKMVSSHLTNQLKMKPPDYRWCEDESLFEDSIRHKKLWVDSFFMLAIIWSFGSLLKE